MKENSKLSVEQLKKKKFSSWDRMYHESMHYFVVVFENIFFLSFENPSNS